MLNIVDAFTHEGLAIRIDRRFKAVNVIDARTDLFILRGAPAYVRSDKGPEFIAKAVKGWIGACQEFRVRAGIMGTKEISHGPTQTADDTRCPA